VKDSALFYGTETLQGSLIVWRPLIGS